MSPRFIQPTSLSEAVEALVEHGSHARIIAGGTAVTLMMRSQLIAPEVLVSLGRVPDLGVGGPADGGLRLGAMASLRDIERSLPVLQRYPALAQACREVGNVRVRNQATIGGNLAEADYASDPPAMLLALEAKVEVTGPRGSRTIPISEFFLGFYTTALEPDEIVTGVVVPNLPASARMSYLKYKSRSSEDRPCVGVAAVVSFEGRACTDLRVAVGAACETPRRLPGVEATAIGEALTDGQIEAIAEGYAQSVETLEDVRGSAWYRTQMIQVHVRRALIEVRDGHR